MAKKARALQTSEFFTKQQFQEESAKIETAVIELGEGEDTKTVSIRFVGIPFSDHKRLAGLKAAGVSADTVNEEHLDFMVELIQKSLVTEDGERMFTIEELEALNGPLFNKIGAAVLGQEGKNS